MTRPRSNPSDPGRLLEDPELGPSLEQLKVKTQISAQRLQRNAAALRQRLEGLSPGAGPGSGGAAGLGVKVGLPLLVVAGVVAWYATRSRPPAPPAKPAAVSEPQRQRPAEPTGAAPAKDAIEARRGPAQPVETPTEAAEPTTAAAPAAPGAGEPGVGTGTRARAKTRIRARTRVRAGAGERPGQGRASPDEQSPGGRGDLQAQLRLFDEARAEADAGKFRRALALLRRLLQRYPGTPLRAEAEVSSADYLMRSGQLAAATRAVRKLLNDPSHHGRWAELWRVLGDLLRRQGDCSSAAEAYARALQKLTAPEEIAAARRGLSQCQPARR